EKRPIAPDLMSGIWLKIKDHFESGFLQLRYSSFEHRNKFVAPVTFEKDQRRRIGGQPNRSKSGRVQSFELPLFGPLGFIGRPLNSGCRRCLIARPSEPGGDVDRAFRVYGRSKNRSRA